MRRRRSQPAFARTAAIAVCAVGGTVCAQTESGLPHTAAAPPRLAELVESSEPDAVEPYTLEGFYTSDVFAVARGGRRSRDGIAAFGNLDLLLNADTTALGWWGGGKFFVFGEHFFGRTLTPGRVDDFQFYDEFEPAPRQAPFAQVTEYWLDQELAEGWFVKLGKMDANHDFIYPNFGADFINSSFSLVPTVLPPTYPNCAQGVMLRHEIENVGTLRVGTYDGAPFLGVNTGGGWAFDSVGHYGGMTLAEMQFQFTISDLPGNLRVGGWYHTARFARQGDPTAPLLRGNFGGWVCGEQTLLREMPGPRAAADAATDELGLFYQYGWAPGDRNTAQTYFGGGLFRRGWMPGRPADSVGIGFGHVIFSDELRAAEGNTTETAIELFWKAEVTPWLRVQPELQYIANPNGLHRDALLVGIRTEIAL